MQALHSPVADDGVGRGLVPVAAALLLTAPAADDLVCEQHPLHIRVLEVVAALVLHHLHRTQVLKYQQRRGRQSSKRDGCLVTQHCTSIPTQ